MQKLSLVLLLVVASLGLAGCTGDDAAVDSVETPSVRQPMGAESQETSPGEAMEEEVVLPVAQPDPVADQQGMKESQNDAPTGVPTQ